MEHFYITVNNLFIETLLLSWKKNGKHLFTKNKYETYTFGSEYSKISPSTINEYHDGYNNRYPAQVLSMSENEIKWIMCDIKTMKDWIITINNNKKLSIKRAITFNDILKFEGFTENSTSNINLYILKFSWNVLNFKTSTIKRFIKKIGRFIGETFLFLGRLVERF